MGSEERAVRAWLEFDSCHFQEDLCALHAQFFNQCHG